MKPKRNQETCYCAAYEFPHRLGGGSCKGEYDPEVGLSPYGWKVLGWDFFYDARQEALTVGERNVSM